MSRSPFLLCFLAAHHIYSSLYISIEMARDFPLSSNVGMKASGWSPEATLASEEGTEGRHRDLPFVTNRGMVFQLVHEPSREIFYILKIPRQGDMTM